MTFDEARLLANVNARAQRLFDDGYRARWKGGRVLEVRNGRGGIYLVDTLNETCDCPFFRGHQRRHSCKHALGWRRRLARQRACRHLITLLMMRAWADLEDADPCAREADEIGHARGTGAAHANP